MIPKGCTALNSFHIPYNAAEIAVVWVTYVQAGAIGSTMTEVELQAIAW